MERKLSPKALRLWETWLNSIYIFRKLIWYFLQFSRNNNIGENGANAVFEGIEAMTNLTQLHLDLKQERDPSIFLL